MSTLLTLAGIILGSVLTYLFTRSHENKRHLRLLQTESYADYLRCVAEAAHVNLQTDEANLFARAADAKTRICLYGSKDVVTLLAASKGLVECSRTKSNAKRSSALSLLCEIV
jgi:tRNA G46 methylase TrmB